MAEEDIRLHFQQDWRGYDLQNMIRKLVQNCPKDAVKFALSACGIRKTISKLSKKDSVKLASELNSLVPGGLWSLVDIGNFSDPRWASAQDTICALLAPAVEERPRKLTKLGRPDFSHMYLSEGPCKESSEESEEWLYLGEEWEDRGLPK